MDDPQVVSALRGAKYGAAAGLGAAVFVVSDGFPISFLSVPPGFVFGYWIGIGMAIGAGIGWWRAGRVDDQATAARTQPRPESMEDGERTQA